MSAISGSRLFIGVRVAPKVDIVPADFAGMPWTEVGGLTTLGTLGLSQNWVSASIGGFDIQAKGTRSGQVMENVFADLPLDAGQLLLKDAEGCGTYAFKVEYDCSTMAMSLFYGQVGPSVYPGGDANTARLVQVPIAITSLTEQSDSGAMDFSLSEYSGLLALLEDI